MNFTLTADQKMIQETLHKFALQELDPVASEMDQKGEYPRKIFAQLAQMEITALALPEQSDGQAIDSMGLVLALQELSGYWLTVAFVLLNHNSAIYALSQSPHCNELVDELLAGRKIATLAFLEPNGGYDELKVTSQAVPQGEQYVLSGQKLLVASGTQADLFIWLACLPDGQPACFLVPRDKLKITPQKRLLGMQAAGCAELELAAVHLDKQALLGPAANPATLWPQIRDLYHLGLSAMAVGVAQHAFELACQYSKERQQFGRPIGKFPMVQERIINMARAIAGTRLMVYQDACQPQQASPLVPQLPLTLLNTTEMAMRVTIDAVQVHGGNGYTKDYPLERYMRDAQVLRMAGGSPESLYHCAAQEIWRS